jgi:hypothetical protein
VPGRESAQGASTTAATGRKGSSSASLDVEGERWLKEQLACYGYTEIAVKQSRVKWTVKADGAKIGQVEARAIADRDLFAVQRMLRLPDVVRVEVIRPTPETFEGDDAKELLRKARQDLNDELFEAGRLMAKYLTILCEDLRWEDRGRQAGYSDDSSARMTWARRRLDEFENERLEKTGRCFSKGVKDVITATVDSAFKKWNKSNYADRLAAFTSGTILLRNICWELKRTTAPVRWVVRFAIHSEQVPTKSGGKKPQLQWREVVVSTNKNPSVHAKLRKMLSGEIAPCDAKLVWERGNRTWAFRLTGMRQQPERAKGANVMAIRRGLAHPLHMTLADGWVKDIDGGAYLHAKKGLHARKSRLQAGQWVRGKGNTGHGRTKRQLAREHLSTAERDLTRTTIRQWWGNAVKIAKRRNVSAIVVEDFSVPVDKEFLDTLPDELAWLMRRFPWGEVKAWGEWVCKKNGIRMIEVSAAGRAHICPCCGDESPENYRSKTHETLCVACDAHMPTDWCEGWNMLIRSGMLKDDSALKSRQRGWQKWIREHRKSAA